MVAFVNAAVEVGIRLQEALQGRCDKTARDRAQHPHLQLASLTVFGLGCRINPLLKCR